MLNLFLNEQQAPPTGYFITGTDTGVGKTWVTQQLIQQLNSQGYRTIGLKPVSSGSQMTPCGLRNEDALILQKSASQALPYDWVNPYVFAPPIAPHIAAQQAGVQLSVESLRQHIDTVHTHYDNTILLVEGVGGWLVPLNTTETVADLAHALQLPVILVVGIRLGCLNHALLTWHAIQASGVPILGWIANQIAPPIKAYAENLQTLSQWIEAPCLGEVPYTK